MYWILGELLSNTLAHFSINDSALCQVCGAENIGYLPSVINLANIVEDLAEVIKQENTHMNMAAMYILARVTSSEFFSVHGFGWERFQKYESVPNDDGQTVYSLARCRPSLG